jgi:hypothetical protein
MNLNAELFIILAPALVFFAGLEMGALQSGLVTLGRYVIPVVAATILTAGAWLIERTHPTAPQLEAVEAAE